MKTRMGSLGLALCAVLVIHLSCSDLPGRGGRFGASALASSMPEAAMSVRRRMTEILPAQSRIAAAYGNLPLSFEANRGQTDPRVKFLSRGRGYSLLLTTTETMLSLDAIKNVNIGQTASSNRKAVTRTEPLRAKQRSVPRHRPALLRIGLAGANPAAAHMTGLDELSGKVNYFLGSDLKKWRTDIPTYSKVRCQNVYRGVDLIYYGNQEGLESDFVIAPGINPSVIRLRFRGAKSIVVNRAGDLVLKISGGEIMLRKPVAYQLAGNDVPGSNSGKHFVTARYIVENTREVAFAVGDYDAKQLLVIDPVLAYSTYLGGTSNDFGNAIASDASGNAYVAGYTTSTDFPTAAPIQGSYHPSGQNCVNGSAGFPIVFPCPDAFVTKFNASGTAVLYSTYLGGSDYDVANGIAVDSSGNAYVAGQTFSPDFPTKNPAQGSIGPDNCSNELTGAVPCADAFVAKLNPTGDTLVFSTYLGGSASDGANALAVDSFGSTYVMGITSSTDFPTTSNAYDRTCGTDGTCNTNAFGSRFEDAFVTKFDPSGSRLLYSTYLGGNSTDYGTGIAVDSSANVYVTGVTYSIDFPTTSGAFDSTCGTDGGCNPNNVGGLQPDSFVAKLDSSLSGAASLIYATYLGGSGIDNSTGIAVDVNGNTFVAGTTTSADFPTQNPFQASSAAISNGGSAAFIAELNPSGTALVYSTYLGGSGSDVATGIALDSSGNTYVTGRTLSSDFPVSRSVQAAIDSNGRANAFVTVLDSTGSKLVYSSYLGGTGGDFGKAISVDISGDAFVTGETHSNFPVTLGSFRITGPGSAVCTGQEFSIINPLCADAFVAKISPADLPGFVVLPVSLDFGTQAVSTSAAQTITLLDAGNQPLTITSIAFTGSDASNFSDTTTCPISSSTLAGGTKCTISVTFSPQVLGTKVATLVMTDDAAGSPHSIPLTGVSATPPTAVVSPSRLVFGSPVGSLSSPQIVTLTNNGGAPLHISAVNVTPGFQIGGTINGIFPPTVVNGGTSSAFDIAFVPQTTGQVTGTLSFVDDAAQSPQTVTLSGTGQDFALSSSSNSATINAGQAATFTLSVTPESGFNQATNLSCSVTPMVFLGPVCSVVPASVTPNGSTAATATMTITTTSPGSSSAAMIDDAILPDSRLWTAIFCLPALGCIFIVTPRRREAWLGVTAVLLLAVLSFACGGGGSNTKNGTPATSYTLTVTATSGSLTHTINLTLKVN